MKIYKNISIWYATDSQMKINSNKCETILFRPPIRKCNYNIRKKWKSLKITGEDNNCIPNKQVVKYLGIY